MISKMTSTSNELFIKNQSCKDVSRIAKKLSKILEIGDILLLKGPIGTGKSFFARILIREYFKKEKVYQDIPSPSFSLVQTYDNITPKVCHVDLYRLSLTSELEEIGLDNIFENFITIIEWPERLGKKMPNSFLKIEFMYCENINELRNIKIILNDFNRRTIYCWLQDLKINSGVLN